ncbi:MAG TPA: c-type cytochrome [Anaerolineales bacterium]|nr:c-type cytochrome [Anaerolineales bacterium]
MTRRTLIALTLGALALPACGGSSGTVAAPAGSQTDLARGQQLFSENCGECHGLDAAGSDEAPAAVGHSPEEVIEQARNPMGDMDPIPVGELSDADLALIAAYLQTLDGAEAHPEIEPGEAEQLHLVAALEAIEDPENLNREEAVSHLEQAVALASGEAAGLYAELLEAVENRRAGVARHELEEILGMAEEH